MAMSSNNLPPPFFAGNLSEIEKHLCINNDDPYAKMLQAMHNAARSNADYTKRIPTTIKEHIDDLNAFMETYKEVSDWLSAQITMIDSLPPEKQQFKRLLNTVLVQGYIYLTTPKKIGET